MLAHDLELLVGQTTGLVQDAVADAELTDVVQDGGDVHPEHLLLGQSEVPRDRHRVGGDPLGVAARVGVLGVDGGSQGADGLEEELLILAQGLPEAPHQRLDVPRHVVEVAAEESDLVRAAHGGADRQIAVGELGGRGGEALQRGDEPPAEREADAEGGEGSERDEAEGPQLVGADGRVGLGGRPLDEHAPAEDAGGSHRGENLALVAERVLVGESETLRVGEEVAHQRRSRGVDAAHLGAGGDHHPAMVVDDAHHEAGVGVGPQAILQRPEVEGTRQRAPDLAVARAQREGEDRLRRLTGRQLEEHLLDGLPANRAQVGLLDRGVDEPDRRRVQVGQRGEGADALGGDDLQRHEGPSGLVGHALQELAEAVGVDELGGGQGAGGALELGAVGVDEK